MPPCLIRPISRNLGNGKRDVSDLSTFLPFINDKLMQNNHGRGVRKKGVFVQKGCLLSNLVNLQHKTAFHLKPRNRMGHLVGRSWSLETTTDSRSRVPYPYALFIRWVFLDLDNTLRLLYCPTIPRFLVALLLLFLLLGRVWRGLVIGRERDRRKEAHKRMVMGEQYSTEMRVRDRNSFPFLAITFSSSITYCTTPEGQDNAMIRAEGSL